MVSVSLLAALSSFCFVFFTLNHSSSQQLRKQDPYRGWWGDVLRMSLKGCKLRWNHHISSTAVSPIRCVALRLLAACVLCISVIASPSVLLERDGDGGRCCQTLASCKLFFFFGFKRNILHRCTKQQQKSVKPLSVVRRHNNNASFVG